MITFGDYGDRIVHPTKDGFQLAKKLFNSPSWLAKQSKSAPHSKVFTVLTDPLGGRRLKIVGLIGLKR